MLGMIRHELLTLTRFYIASNVSRMSHYLLQMKAAYEKLRFYETNLNIMRLH